MNVDDLEDISDEVLPRMLEDRHILDTELRGVGRRIEETSDWGHMVLLDLDGSGAVRRHGLEAKIAVVDQYRALLEPEVAARGATVARSGTRDEIYVYFSTRDEMAGIEFAESIRNKVLATDFVTPEGGIFRLTVSAGVSSAFGERGVDSAAAYARDALFHAKKVRNCVARFSGSLRKVCVPWPPEWDGPDLQESFHRALWIWDESTGPIRYWTTQRKFGNLGYPPIDLRETLSSAGATPTALEVFSLRVEDEMAWARNERSIAIREEWEQRCFSVLDSEWHLLQSRVPLARPGHSTSHGILNAFEMLRESMGFR